MTQWQRKRGIRKKKVSEVRFIRVELVEMQGEGEGRQGRQGRQGKVEGTGSRVFLGQRSQHSRRRVFKGKKEAAWAHGCVGQEQTRESTYRVYGQSIEECLGRRDEETESLEYGGNGVVEGRKYEDLGRGTGTNNQKTVKWIDR